MYIDWEKEYEGLYDYLGFNLHDRHVLAYYEHLLSQTERKVL
jgi:hypothetical protein